MYAPFHIRSRGELTSHFRWDQPVDRFRLAVADGCDLPHDREFFLRSPQPTIRVPSSGHPKRSPRGLVEAKLGLDPENVEATQPPWEASAFRGWVTDTLAPKTGLWV